MSFIGAACLAFYFYINDSLHISEVVGIFLLLLTIVPPNVAIVMRKPGDIEAFDSHPPLGHRRSTIR
ncbi:hypothetical protein [Granulicella arctica]|uniref:hypothetical protein n=1 Tax=Granulicella arctica TaxID=940613 RepID=UPI0015CB0A0F|nr:hypothetical protein [Granulicella arctica]